MVFWGRVEENDVTWPMRPQHGRCAWTRVSKTGRKGKVCNVDGQEVMGFRLIELKPMAGLAQDLVCGIRGRDES